MNKLIIVVIAGIYLTFSSCSESEAKNRFINIKKANTAIFDLTGIDLLKFKNQIENDFEIHEGFYDSIMINTAVNNTNVLVRKYGYYSVTTMGDTITGNAYDSLLLSLTKGFANGMIQEDCAKGKSDSLCIVKMNYYNALSDLSSPVGRVDNTMNDFIYFELYEKRYLTKEEFEFMTLWWYVLSSIQGISDQEWHDKKQL